MIRLPINGMTHEFMMLDIKSLRDNILLTGYDIIGILGSDFLLKNNILLIITDVAYTNHPIIRLKNNNSTK